MTREIPMEDFENLSLENKLMVFNHLHKNINNNLGKELREFLHPYLNYKHELIKQVAISFILKMQQERPFIQPISIEETTVLLEKEGLIKKKLQKNLILKYEFIEKQISKIASNSILEINVEDYFFVNTNIPSKTAEQIYNAICENLIEDFFYLDEIIQYDLQIAVFFASEFFKLHIQHKIPEIISDSIIKEINRTPLSPISKKVISFYLQISKIINETEKYEGNLHLEQIIRGRDANIAKNYKLLFMRNLQDIINKRFNGNTSEFMHEFMDHWQWLDDSQPRRMFAGQGKFQIEDLFIMVKGMDIPCDEFFKDSRI